MATTIIDDFSDGTLDKWTQVAVFAGVFSNPGNSMLFTCGPGTISGGIYTPTPGSEGSWSFTYRVGTPTANTAYANFKLCVGNPTGVFSEANSYMFMMRRSGGISSYHLYSGTSLIKYVGFRSENIFDGATHTLVYSLNGGVLTFSIDGTPVISESDSTFSSFANIMFGIFGFGDGQTITFDDVTLTTATKFDNPDNIRIDMRLK